MAIFVYSHKHLSAYQQSNMIILNIILLSLCWNQSSCSHLDQQDYFWEVYYPFTTQQMLLTFLLVLSVNSNFLCVLCILLCRDLQYMAWCLFTYRSSSCLFCKAQNPWMIHVWNYTILFICLEIFPFQSSHILFISLCYSNDFLFKYSFNLSTHVVEPSVLVNVC